MAQKSDKLALTKGPASNGLAHGIWFDILLFNDEIHIF